MARGYPPNVRPFAMPVGRVASLVGAVLLIAAYAMPWFAVDAGGNSITLSGQFLGRFLASTNDLRRFMPGAAGGPAEVAQLRALVLLFPAAGGLALLTSLATAWWRRRTPADALLVILGTVPLAALAVGLGQLPAGARPEIGLWVIGGGAMLVVLGALTDWVLDRLRPLGQRDEVAQAGAVEGAEADLA
jgi:hypothetical protein